MRKELLAILALSALSMSVAASSVPQSVPWWTSIINGIERMFGLVPTTTTTTTLTSTIPYCPAESQAGCIATTVPQVAQSVSTSVPTTTIQSTTIATPNTWIATASYPLSIDDQSCSPYNGYAYCIGGTQGGMSLTGSVYYARINSNGTPGNWMQTTSYPMAIDDLSCNPYGGFMYCIGGATLGLWSQNAVYYAPINPDGSLGQWIQTTPYPTPIHNEACRIYGGYDFCVGGNPGIAGLNSVEVNSTYYAEILPSGELGAWMQTTPYPTTIEDQACVVYDNYLYCIGGWKSVTYGFTANDYYASLSSSGIVNWTATTAYPFMTSDHKTCGISNNNIVCAGGYINGGQSVTYSAFYAPIGYGGLGQWEQLPAYPSGAWRSMSAISTGSSVCYVGGYNDALGYTTNGVYCIQVG